VQPGGRFWQGCWSARSVVVVEVNGYTIEPGANLEGAYLDGVNVVKADLTEADLFGANLTGANFRGANLGGVDLKGAKANEDTVWPEGFDPVAAGVIFD